MYEYTTYDAMNVGSLDAAKSIGTGTLMCSLAICILMIVSMWKIFKKAGKPGWASIIPIYNIVVLFQVAGLSPWLILLMFIPFANFVIIFLAYIRLAKAFGKGVGFGLGLLFLNIIFMPILAFSNTEYKGE